MSLLLRPSAARRPVDREGMEEPSVEHLVCDRAFAAPPLGIPPAAFVERHLGRSAPDHLRLVHGTTTLGFVYEPATEADTGGIIVAVDSRATGGNYIASQTVEKIIDVDGHIVATMAGGAADCQFWLRYLSKYCSLFALRERTPISAAAASKYLQNVLFSYKDYGLSIGSMIAGYDKTGPNLYKLDTDGTRLKGNLFSVGSGCTHALGVLDAGYKRSMGDEEAVALAKRAIVLATYRDSASGGSVTLVRISASGKAFMGPFDVCVELDKMTGGGEPFAPLL